MTHIDDQGHVVVDVTRADGSHEDIVLADTLPEWAKGTLHPACPACGGYLLPCTKTDTGIHPRGGS